MAQGQNSVVIDETGTIGSANGTSFSSPIMAGTIASFWQAFPTFTNAQILQLVKQSADRYSSPNPQFGYGIPDFNLAKQNALNRTEFSLTDYQLYPNPVSDFVNVIVPDSMIGSVFTLYTPIGQSILKQVLAQPSLTIALENLNRGVYFYKIDSLTGIKTGKIIKR
jgi:subtilisin family serine protease